MSSSADRPRILIADDNPQGLELLEAYLDELDADTKTAADGEQALKLVKEWQPDLLLLDVMMPRISGFEVCKRLRADPASAGLAVLMVTALDQPSDVERGVEAGADDFLTKPIHKLELLLRVRSMLKGSARQNKLERTIGYFEEVEKAGRGTPST